MSRAQKKKDKNDISTLQYNSKTHATLNKKTYVSFYAEDLYFRVVARAGWRVTKIYDHYTFKQDIIKRDFVVMNQNARKSAKTKVGKDFYKLLNNSNFGNDCKNNVGNCKLDLMYDGIEEIKYIENFTDILKNEGFREFFTVDLLKEKFNWDFNIEVEKLDQDDPDYFLDYELLDAKRNNKIREVENFSKKGKRKIQCSKAVDTIESKINKCEDLRKNKMIIEFNDLESSSIKSIAVKSETNIKCTTRFMSGKLLMFAKLSLKSFVYSLIELLHFPEEHPVVASIYEK